MEGSRRYRSGFCTAIARDAGSIYSWWFDPGACAPGFMLASRSADYRRDERKGEGVRMMRTLSLGPSSNLRGGMFALRAQCGQGCPRMLRSLSLGPLTIWRGEELHAGMRALRECGRDVRAPRGYGTILVAGSLQGLWPLGLTAATRNQRRAPEVRPGTVKVDFVDTP